MVKRNLQNCIRIALCKQRLRNFPRAVLLILGLLSYQSGKFVAQNRTEIRLPHGCDEMHGEHGLITGFMTGSTAD